MLKNALMSGCGQYRYALTREWNTENAEIGHALWIMLNPSTADAEQDDPTLRRCMDFTRRWHLGGLCVVNLFALRSSSPLRLLGHADPVGPSNDDTLKAMIGLHRRRQDYILVAWGANADHRLLRERRDAVLRLLPVVETDCLDTTLSGAPRHPLYAPSHLTPNPFTFPASAWR